MNIGWVALCVLPDPALTETQNPPGSNEVKVNGTGLECRNRHGKCRENEFTNRSCTTLRR